MLDQEWINEMIQNILEMEYDISGFCLDMRRHSEDAFVLKLSADRIANTCKHLSNEAQRLIGLVEMEDMDDE